MAGREFLTDPEGVAGSRNQPWHARRLGFLVDPIYDFRLTISSKYRRLMRNIYSLPRQRVLVIGIEVPSRGAGLREVFKGLNSRYHNVVFNHKPAETKGKLQNVNELVCLNNLSDFDWVFMVDDDISFKGDIMDILLACCGNYDFKIAMPAHRFGSYLGYDVTKRSWGTVARLTNFVEIGPLTIFHRDTFSMIFPLPELRYGWGVDLHWPLLAKREGWRLGVVDAAPIKHLRPVGAGYPRDEATREAADYLDAHGSLSRTETFSVLDSW